MIEEVALTEEAEEDIAVVVASEEEKVAIVDLAEMIFIANPSIRVSVMPSITCAVIFCISNFKCMILSFINIFLKV